MQDHEDSFLEKIDAILDEALELANEERIPYIDRICQNDETLRKKLIGILSAAESAPAYLNGNVIDFASSLLNDFRDEEEFIYIPGIDNYEIEQEIGRGGMGVVYKARHIKLDRVVAIKVMRVGVQNFDLRNRFEREQRVLSKLEHPNIARLYEVGLTKDDSPYIVMEYVEGLHLTAYCDERLLSIEQRLLLFVTISKAVLFAHRNLIVHRDIKPSNILVSRTGEPKLLDFGIAKLIDEDSEVSQTKTSDRLMTPKYAAPEQIRPGSITTATDVYQLGAVLYELVTGHLPYSISGLSRHQIELAICEQDPTRPSEKIYDTDDQATNPITPNFVSMTRGEKLERLSKRLRGDLDAIILKALRKQPEARYVPAEAFVEDINRYLGGHAVHAHKGSFFYKTQKFVKRNAIAVSMSFLILLTLIVASLVIFNQYQETLYQAGRSERNLEFVEDLFYQISPEVINNDTLTIKEFANISRQELSKFSGEPLDKAALLSLFGRIHQSLGFYNEAANLHREALVIREKYLPEGHSELSESYHYLSYTLFYLREFAESQELAEKAYTYRLRTSSHQDTLVLESLEMVAYNHYNMGNREKADSLFRIARNSCHQAGAEFQRVCTVIYSAYSTLRRAMGDYDGAEELLLEAISEAEAHNQNTTTLAALKKNLGMLYARQDRHEEAIKLFQSTVTIYQAVLGEGSNQLGSSYYNIGRSYNDLNRISEAKLYFSYSIKTYQATTVIVAQEAYPYIELGKILIKENLPNEAELNFNQALDIYLHNGEQPGDSRRLAVVNEHLAKSLALQGRTNEAISIYKQSYDYFNKIDEKRAANILIILDQLQSTGQLY